MSNKLRSVNKEQRKVLQARQDARTEKINVILATHQDALMSAYVIGQAMFRPPQTPEDVAQIKKAMVLLAALQKRNLIPGPVLTGLQELDKLMGAALAKDQLPGEVKGETKTESGIILPNGVLQVAQ